MKEKEKYINREINWVEFNNRVLEEAADIKNPLFERLKFMSIVSSNLDEFFMIRVASLHDQIKAGFRKKDITGLTPLQQFKKVNEKIHATIKAQYDCLKKLTKLLKLEGIQFYESEQEFDTRIEEYIEDFYYRNIYPVITPMVVDKSRPFPLILSKSLNIALLLENKESDEEPVFATVQVPSVLERFIKIPSQDKKNHMILMENVITMFLEKLFDGHKIICYGYYRITRNADSGLDEEGAEDLLEAIEQFVKKKKWGAVIRLEVDENMCDVLLGILEREFEVPKEGIYRIKGPIDLTFLMKLINLEGFLNLRFPEFKSQIPFYVSRFNDENLELKENEKNNIFAIIDKKDGIIHHPFESFDFIVDMINQAALDPEVLAIKQTLYRVSGNSPIVEALVKAAETGKQVTVLVELKARFDEENNMLWAKQLEMAGCHVIYGLVGLKIHCKMLLIIRKDNGQLKRYVHLGTGNYNDITANLYTDIGFFTCNPYIGADISAIFNMLSGYSRLSSLYKLYVAPVVLRQKFITLIKQEIKNVSEGKNGKIIVKVNSLVDKEIIDWLYKASSAGVNIELIIRGICCLRAKVPGLSDNINVRSIIGRFLEHSRIFYFYNGGSEQMFLSSADWMPRNLDRRVEILFPIESVELSNRLKEILRIYIEDSVKSRIMDSTGAYKKVNKKQGIHLSSQEYFYKELKEIQKKHKKEQKNTFKNL